MNNRKLTPGGTATVAVIPWYQLAPFVLAYQPLGAASLAASYVNLVNPGTYNASPASAPTFNPLMGWTFAGNRLLTNYTLPQTTNLSIIVRIANHNSAASNHQWLCGIDNGKFGIRLRLNAITQFTFANGGEYVSTINSSNGGVVCFTGGRCFYNGALLGTFSNTGVTGGSNFEIGRMTGTSYDCYTDICAFGMSNSIWSDAQVENISAKLLALPL